MINRPISRLTLALLLMGLAAGCDTSDPEPVEILLPRDVRSSDYTQTESGLRYFDFEVGGGAEAADSSVVQVHFAAWLGSNAALLSNTFDNPSPVTVDLTSDNVLEGFAEGIVGMRVGGERQLVVPPSLAYGEQGRPPSIPGNATLIYEIELLSVETP